MLYIYKFNETKIIKIKSYESCIITIEMHKLVDSNRLFLTVGRLITPKATKKD